ncbi:MAG: hypothetical protein ABW098_18870, partial [Candidatus Thiodiazotropha sp.]
ETRGSTIENKKARNWLVPGFPILHLVAGAGCQLDLLITARDISATSGALLYSKATATPDLAADCSSQRSSKASGGRTDV